MIDLVLWTNVMRSQWPMPKSVYQRSGTVSGGAGAVTVGNPFAEADFRKVFRDMSIKLPWR